MGIEKLSSLKIHTHTHTHVKSHLIYGEIAKLASLKTQTQMLEHLDWADDMTAL